MTSSIKQLRQYNYIAKLLLGFLETLDHDEIVAGLINDIRNELAGTPPRPITRDQLFPLCARLAGTLEIPGLGLLVGKQLNVLDMGVLGYTQYTAPTLRHAAIINQRFTDLVTAWLRVTFVFRANEVSCHFEFADNLADVRQFFIELELAAYVQSIRLLTRNSDINPRIIYLDYSAPSHANQYADLFKCPVQFDADSITLVFDAHYFDTPLPTHDPTPHDAMLGLCERLLAEIGMETDLMTRCERLIQDRLMSNPSLEFVANRLGVSPRTLSRQLNQRGKPFKQLVSELRLEKACEYLRGTELTLQRISELCGFTSNQSFSHIFKRYRKISPTEYRNQLRT